MGPIFPISSLDDPALEVYSQLTENQLRNRQDPSQALFIAESPKVITRALDAGYEVRSFLVEERQLDAQAQPILERCPQATVYTAPMEVLTALTGFALTRGLLAAMRRKPLPNPEDLLASARRVAILENVMNPTNVGAIFRSAAALGVDAVLLTPDCSDPFYRRAARVSMGTVFQIPWTYLSASSWQWPERGLAALRQAGFQSAALALREDSLSLRDPRLRQSPKLAMILGAEGDGLSSATIEGCDYCVRIPMAHGVDSLNVAAASAVAFWELASL